MGFLDMTFILKEVDSYRDHSVERLICRPEVPTNVILDNGSVEMCAAATLR